MDSLKDLFPHIPARIAKLGDLAYNLWWSWRPEARMLFKSLDRIAWKESCHNPVRMLRDLPPEIIDAALRNNDYLRHYDVVSARFYKEMDAKGGWFSENVPETDHLPIAYFSAEYGLHHSLPFYAGGLGFLAGDHLKECSDLGVPLVAVGFMYPEGYLKQRILSDGWQEDVDEVLERDAAPITRVLDREGKQVVIKVPFMDPPVYLAVWKVQVGRIPLYLMDTDIEINTPWNRMISAHLYTGDMEQRLRQEIVLGLGGSEVLNALGIKHSGLHLNEGHPSFAILERIREKVNAGMGFREASEEVRQTTIFTTHTPVPAGHDVFPTRLMDKYFGGYYSLLKIERDAFLRMGASPEKPGDGFNMTAFALQMSSYRNGVSRRHGEVSRRMWQPLWPGVKTEDVPIAEITNGVHIPTWLEPKIVLLFNRYLGPQWLEEHDRPEIWELIEEIPDKELWQVHYLLKMKLINFIRGRVRQRWVEDGITPTNVVAGGTLLDPVALTVGFARRFVSYKRADLIFENMERLKGMLNDRWRPVQFIFAGKAHPADEAGKRIIQRVFSMAADPALGGRIAFVENYDEQLAQYMTHGVDLWLNNPLPPLEASGTSGMKAAVNGVPQLSIMDGWWIEGYNGKNGWAFEPGKTALDDAGAIYDLLEKEIIPLYYRTDENGIPHGWTAVMKEAIRSSASSFSARRMVKEYILKFYQGALKAAAKGSGRQLRL
ncbi:MAG: alpha-glucan family phosphorylase [Thermodesulfovibrionales bacterium]|jgi:starch phosphorylase